VLSQLFRAKNPINETANLPDKVFACTMLSLAGYTAAAQNINSAPLLHASKTYDKLVGFYIVNHYVRVFSIKPT
jgi:hypothetical protein